MDFQLIINGAEYVSGSLYIVALVCIIIISFLFILIRTIVHQLHSNENLKYEFITIIAHKFRTPLTQTKWILETIFSMENDPFKKESLENLSQSNEKLINLTNTLVELTDSANTNLGAYNLERVNLCELVNRVVNNLSDDFHKKNIFFGMQCSEPEIFVRVDRPRMEFVIQTLVENSIIYTPPGKNVDIIVATKRKKTYVQVADKGIGIDSSEIPHIFSKFYRSPSAQSMDTEGFGVNLYLANTVVKRHKGKIEVFSEGYQRGSTFTLVLPKVK